MTTLQPETVAIRQLRICSKTGADNTRMTQEAARLRQDLEWADWPDASGESWVFIRRLHAKGLRSQVVQQLVQDARQHVQGDSGDNVVRFTGLTEMLTALLTDLVQTGTPRPWYWQRWAHLFALSLPRAVADLLTDQSMDTINKRSGRYSIRLPGLLFRCSGYDEKLYGPAVFCLRSKRGTIPE